MIIIVLLVLGVCFGSFVNALTWRLHEQEKLNFKEKLSKNDKKKIRDLSILKGRSMCPVCKHELAAKDLVPVVSWLSLRGKCRYCQITISWQYPLIELIMAFLFIASYLWWPVAIHGSQVSVFVLWLPLLIGFVALVIYDLRWLILPNRIVYPLAVIALVVAVINIAASPRHLKALLDVFLAVAIGGGLFYVLYQVSNGKWIGGGDVRLGFLLGILAGSPGRSLLLLFLASLLGTIVSVPLLALNRLKRSSVIPFGPFLIIAAVIVQLFGKSILSWYTNSFFPNGL